jgi:RNA polymerase sigma-70 factor (ECF subfamily)
MINWNELVTREAQKLLNYVNKIVGSIDNSHDIVQDTFYACYQNIDRIDKSYLLAWLYKTAHNKALNFIKKDKRFVYGVVIEQHYDDGLEEALNEKKRKFVQMCFQKLKPKHAMVLELQYYQKKSYKEIAEIMNMSPSAVESILVRAKKECKKIMIEMGVEVRD